MHSLARPQAPAWHANSGTRVPKETLHMLGAVLKTAFRMHCTGEFACGKAPWQLVQDVERKLVALSQEPATAISESRLARYVEAELCDRAGLPAPSCAEVA